MLLSSSISSWTLLLANLFLSMYSSKLELRLLGDLLELPCSVSLNL